MGRFCHAKLKYTIMVHLIMVKKHKLSKEIEHFKLLCGCLGRREDKSDKAKNAANAIHWRVFSTPPAEAATGISGCKIS